MTSVDASLDLRGVRCPMNYIKTKLKLEELPGGSTLEVFVDEGEAVRGIPMGLCQEGHAILVSEAAHPGHRLVIRKANGPQP